ncbi:MAG: energy transducer TonB [Verrucomicrobia bacterium]|nr:energy transducer TonB [Verrucomicrobiota bacterium]
MAAVLSIARTERVCAWAAALGGCAVVVCLLGVWADPVRAPHEHDHDHGPGAPVQYFRPPPSAPALAAAAPAPVLAALPTPVVEAPLAEVTPVVPITAAPALVSLVLPAVAPPQTTLKPIASPAAPAPATAEPFTTTMPGDFPEPPYPRWARQQGLQGNLLVLVEVSSAGSPTSVIVRESCGSTALDDHAVGWVRQRWTWAPGPPRRFLVPFIFQLQ